MNIFIVALWSVPIHMKTKTIPNNPIINKFKELQTPSALSNLKTISNRVIASLVVIILINIA